MSNATITRQYQKTQAQAVALALIAASTPFSIEPLPYDVYAITLKAEIERLLPIPLAPNDARDAYLPWQDWLSELRQNHATALDGSTPTDSELLDMFARGLTPAEAVAVVQDEDGADTATLGPSVPDVPVVLVRINGGAVYYANATVPARLIILDEDTEGSDGERIATIGGEALYCHDHLLIDTAWTDEKVHPALVARIAAEVDTAFQNAPATPLAA